MSDNSNEKPAIPQLHELKWDPENIEDSLDKVYQVAVYKVRDAASYYQKNSKSKKFGARFCRFVAIIMTTLGGVIPILSQMFDFLDPAWASVAIAIAAAFLGLDKFLGYSTAWMRFITTELKISEKLETFEFEWIADKVSWQEDKSNRKKARAMVLRCASFTSEISKIVQEETRAWVDEFQSALTKLDESTKIESDKKKSQLEK